MNEYQLKNLTDEELSRLHKRRESAICKSIKEYNKNHSKDHKKELNTLLKEGKLINKEMQLRIFHKAAVLSLIRWAKGNEENFDVVQKDVDNWLEISHCNGSSNGEDLIAHRKIAIESLIICCISQCNTEELNKLDDIKQKLASSILN